jgi:capsular exopolysaccharide synthesis family protein
MELNKQEIEMQKMLRDRKPAHPDVQALQKSIDEATAKLGQAGKTALSSEVTSNNPVYDSMVQNYVSAVAEHAAADSARGAAAVEIAAVKPQLNTLPAEEAKLAQLTLDEDAARNTYTLLRQKLDEATIREQEAENVNAIQVVDQARSGPSDTRKNLKLLLALVLAPILCAGMAFLMNYLDNTVKTPEEVEALLNIPVFAVVPIARSHSLSDGKHVSAVIGASYQMLSTNLWISHAEMQGHTVLVASAEPDVGRSTTAANLAISLARDGARVILVDSDLRQPSQHEFFGISNEKGLSNVLVGRLPLKDALQPTSVTDLLLIPSGPLPANPVRMFRSPEMVKFVKEVNELADFIIFDSPSGAAFADATLLAVLVKNVMIVHAAGSVPRGAEAEFHARLEQVDANLLGAVLNMVRPEDSHGYYHFKSGYEESMGGNGKHIGAALPVGRITEVSDDPVQQEARTNGDPEA